MKITASNLIRWAGLSAMGAGLLFVAIQAIHPLDLLFSVTSPRWAIVHYMGVTMCILGLFGMTGIYARQIEDAGWLGLAGYLLFSLFYALSMAFQFVEAFISPALATVAQPFVEGLLGVSSGHATGFSLGALPMVYMFTGLAGYLLGGLLFGIATFRAAILPRWAGALLAVGVVLPILGSSLVQHPFDRIFAVPVGLAVAWLGYALWSERRQQASEPLLTLASSPLGETGAD